MEPRPNLDRQNVNAKYGKYVCKERLGQWNERSIEIAKKKKKRKCGFEKQRKAEHTELEWSDHTNFERYI